MADVTYPVLSGQLKKLEDMGDGTFADRVVIINQDGSDPATLPTGTDRSGAITTGGTAQALAASNTSRRGLTGQNISTGDLWINEIGGTAAADTAGSYRVPPGSAFKVSTSRAVSIVGATTGQKFTATEW